MLTASEQAEFNRITHRRAFRRVPKDAILRSQQMRDYRKECGLSLAEMDLESVLAECLPISGAATNFNVIYDSTAPAGVTMVINGNATYATSQSATLTISTTDTPTTGYQMLIWGSVDNAANANIQTTQGASTWITYGTSQAVTLLTGDGLKTINIQIRDDVWNASGTVTDTITLDTVAPVPNIVTGPDATKISSVAGKRTVNFGWQTDAAFDQYEVAVVSSAGSARGSGTVVGTTNGSTNVAGSAGGYPATTTISTAIDGRDLVAASAGDGTKVVKVFVKDTAGNWSV